MCQEARRAAGREVELLLGNGVSCLQQLDDDRKGLSDLMQRLAPLSRQLLSGSALRGMQTRGEHGQLAKAVGEEEHEHHVACTEARSGRADIRRPHDASHRRRRVEHRVCAMTCFVW